MFYDVYLALCKRDGKKPSTVAAELGINKSNVSNWKSNGYTPRGEALQRIADYFGVTADYLLSGEETQTAPTLTQKDERDIARKVERIMTDMENGGDLMFDGNPMSPEAKESLAAAMKLGLEAAKLKNKERFTPKKRR